MRLAVFGASGGTGRQIVSQALRGGHTVAALARDLSKIPAQNGLTVTGGSTKDAASVAAVVAGADAVLCALGGRPWRRSERVCSSAMPRIIEAMRRHGVRRIIAISTFGAGETRPQVGLPFRALVFPVILRTEVADKEAMERQLADSGLDWTVARIGVLDNGPERGGYRVRDDGSIHGMGKISRADLARFMLSEIEARAWVRKRPVLIY
jgi:putative NADH-flavin reductase